MPHRIDDDLLAELKRLAIAHGATLVSCDSDFARFAALRWENPAARS